MKNIKHLILVGIIILLIYILIPSAENPKQDFTIPWEIEFLGQEINIQKLDLASQELWVKHLMVEGFNSYQLRLYLYRSQQYFPFIEQYLSENNLPEDLKYLAVAESALRPTAHSHAGAAGIWQFMPGTAQDYNLSITSTIDERLHFEKATVSAISYIQKLYNRFNDYYLALAAYNVGQWNLSVMLDYQWVTNFFDLYLNSETASYIFRIMAIKYAMEYPQEFGVHIEQSDMFSQSGFEYKEYQSIENLVNLAQSEGVTYKDIRMLNPWIRGDNLWSGPWTVKILEK